MQGFGATFANRVGAETKIAMHDIVQLAGGSQMIVTGIFPNRPSNPFVGVLVTGKGAQYKFGHKHNPVVIGKADANHPALRARQARVGMASDQRLEILARLVVDGKLVEAKDMANSILAVV